MIYKGEVLVCGSKKMEFELEVRLTEALAIRWGYVGGAVYGLF